MMVRFDFSTYTDKFLKKEKIEELESKKDEIVGKLEKSTMNGWMKRINEEEVREIFRVRDDVLSKAKCLVVIGIGGSFLGSYALYQMFKKKGDFELIYLGNNLSSKKLSEALECLKDKDFFVNVISKSGKTTEVKIAFDLIKEELFKKYGETEGKRRIIVTTDKERGQLLEEAKREGYYKFVIPSDIGGRYSLLTPAHLFPLSFIFDIKDLIRGYYEGFMYQDFAYSYATRRVLLNETGKNIENFSIYEPDLYYYTEWLKQLFGETEGKNKKGIFPVSTIGTRDLHSLGQFIQEGAPIVFETFIKIGNVEYFPYKGTNLDRINNLIVDAVVKAHYLGGVPCNIIYLDNLSVYDMGLLSSFFMQAAAFSALLFEVDPFNQPGVEVYKKFVSEEMEKLIDE